MTVHEPRVTADDRELILALERHEDTQCPRCGLPTSICQDPANEGQFIAEPPIRCQAMTAIVLARRDYTDENAQALEALIWTPPVLASDFALRRQGGDE